MMNMFSDTSQVLKKTLWPIQIQSQQNNSEDYHINKYLLLF